MFLECGVFKNFNTKMIRFAKILKKSNEKIIDIVNVN